MQRHCVLLYAKEWKSGERGQYWLCVYTETGLALSVYLAHSSRGSVRDFVTFSSQEPCFLLWAKWKSNMFLMIKLSTSTSHNFSNYQGLFPHFVFYILTTHNICNCFIPSISFTFCTLSAYSINIIYREK